jgi:hypothetical protein
VWSKKRESKKLCTLLYYTIYVLQETYEMRLHCMLNKKNYLFGRKPLRFWSGLKPIFSPIIYPTRWQGAQSIKGSVQWKKSGVECTFTRLPNCLRAATGRHYLWVGERDFEDFSGLVGCVTCVGSWVTLGGCRRHPAYIKYQATSLFTAELNSARKMSS